jgi:hypothetical protein
MKPQFEITDKALIDDILQTVSYGTLALCKNDVPYSVPVNFVFVDEVVYFHGAKSGKKASLIEQNGNCSFSVVQDFSVIRSYFSSDEGLACPASHFFKSVIVEGKVEIVNEYAQKAFALEMLMQKLQPEGRYKQLTDTAYEKMINATQVFKITPREIKGKIKLGQHLPKQRFERIITHLKERGSEIDKLTIKQMKSTIEI